jgi:hypothetical protein
VPGDGIDSRTELDAQLDLSANLLGRNLQDKVLAPVSPESSVAIAVVRRGVSNLVPEVKEPHEVFCSVS